MAEEQNEMFENTVKRTSRAEQTREKSVGVNHGLPHLC
jgi:hypothetical protein